MMSLARVVLLLSVISVIVNGFISPHVRCFSGTSASRWRTRLMPVRSRIRDHVARRAAEENSASTTAGFNDDATAAEVEANAKLNPATPKDMDYYSGLVGLQPGEEERLAKGEVGTAKDYPINLPSYLLLLLATVACIAFVGSIFEVTGPNPELGYTPTYIIGTLAFPTFIFLFYSAIKKGQAEVEEDDARYRGGRGW